jgi:ABC-type thiamine transport system ATPase subunit
VTAPQPDDPGRTRPFADVLIELNRGKTHAELSRALQDVIAAVRDTGKPGKLAFALAVKPARADGMVEITDQVAVKLPAYDRPASMFFVTDDANLSRNDPRQTELDLGLRPVPTDHREAR